MMLTYAQNRRMVDQQCKITAAGVEHRRDVPTASARLLKRVFYWAFQLSLWSGRSWFRRNAYRWEHPVVFYPCIGPATRSVEPPVVGFNNLANGDAHMLADDTPRASTCTCFNEIFKSAEARTLVAEAKRYLARISDDEQPLTDFELNAIAEADTLIQRAASVYGLERG